MKVWVDDVREAPDGYEWCKNVCDAIYEIEGAYMYDYAGVIPDTVEVIDMDHDAGDYAKFGGDYIKLLDWLEEKGYNIPIHIHSMNPVGVENMRRIIRRNNWKEV